MSKYIVLGPAFLIFSIIVSFTTHAENNTSTIPDEVREVMPEPDKRIDCSPNSFPLGIQNISIVFTKDIIVNNSCTEEAHIYREGETEPFQTVGISGVSIDYEKSNIGSVFFPNSCSENGRYRVTIPEGFWKIGTSSPALSGAFELYYEILIPQVVTPAECVAQELSAFRLGFPGYDKANILNPQNIELFEISTGQRYPLSVSLGQKSDGSADNYISICLKEPITTQGDYNLFIKANAAEGIKYGPNYPSNPEDITRESNTESIYRYTVSSLPAPSIQPAPGMIESFSTFKLDIPDGAEFWFVNDKAISYIYQVKDNGELAADPISRLTSSRIGDSNSIELTITDKGEAVEKITPPAGKYALKLGNGLFSGSWDGNFINSAPFLYYYEIIDSGEPDVVHSMPEAIEGNKEGIYNLNGVKVMNNGNSEIQNLPPGIYIVNGQKVFINQCK